MDKTTHGDYKILNAVSGKQISGVRLIDTFTDTIHVVPKKQPRRANKAKIIVHKIEVDKIEVLDKEKLILINY